MPLYRLEEIKTKKVRRVRRMSHEVARALNDELATLEDGTRWRRGIQDDKEHKQVNNLAPVFRFLDLEGFGDHHVQEINRFLKREAVEVTKRERSFEAIYKRFRDTVRFLPEEDRKAVGKFISSQCGRSFAAGLRLGMAAAMTAGALEPEAHGPAHHVHGESMFFAPRPRRDRTGPMPVEDEEAAQDAT